jgi:hypothetical protein
VLEKWKQTCHAPGKGALRCHGHSIINLGTGIPHEETMPPPGSQPYMGLQGEINRSLCGSICEAKASWVSSIHSDTI